MENQKVKQGAIPEILDVGDIAELMRITPDTARGLIEKGTIPGWKFARGKYLISKRLLIETIEKGS